MWRYKGILMRYFRFIQNSTNFIRFNNTERKRFGFTQPWFERCRNIEIFSNWIKMIFTTKYDFWKKSKKFWKSKEKSSLWNELHFSGEDSFQERSSCWRQPIRKASEIEKMHSGTAVHVSNVLYMFSQEIASNCISRTVQNFEIKFSLLRRTD